MIALLSGCGGGGRRVSRKSFKKEARQLVKQAAPSATVRVVGGRFQVEDSRGQVVMVAHVPNGQAVLQPSDPSSGPVTVYRADWMLYKEGKPSLWLKAPVATWQAGLLTASKGARSGSVDGKIAVDGKTATWTARTDLLAVSTANCALRDPGRPVIRARGPRATWQNGLLVLPAGAAARAADGSASWRADYARWRAKTHSLEATGRVRMTQGRMAGAGGRLTGDTALRSFRLTGGRPRLTIYNQPAPPVVTLADAGRQAPDGRRSHRMVLSPSPASRALAGSLLALVAFSGSPALAAARPSVHLASGIVVEANDIHYDPGTGVHAVGDVMLTRPSAHQELRADQVDAKPAKQKPAGKTAPPVQEAQATGHVRITSTDPAKPDERMEATGAAGTYWPETQKATLTGGVAVTMASPQLEEPAVMTGERANIDLGRHTAEVLRTPKAPVLLRLRPKPQPASAAHPASAGTRIAAAGPLLLEGDRILLENAANRVTATGSPVLTSDQGTVRAQTIWFEIDPKARDVKTVHAVGAVRIDAQDVQRGTFHGTADQAELDQAANTVSLTGHAEGTLLQPGNTEPNRFAGEKLTYDLKTGAWTLGAAPERRAQVTFKPRPKPGAGGSTGENR